MRARYERYGAVAAHPVAAFRDFKVGVVTGRRQAALVHQVAAVCGAELLYDAVPVEFAVKFVYFRDLLLQLLAVSLAQASHHVEFLQLAALLSIGKLKYRVYAFLFRVSYEAASVYHGHLALWDVRVVSHAYVVGAQLRHQAFAVHQVL